jgi:predicted MFS family arabinose efflux permease
MSSLPSSIRTVHATTPPASPELTPRLLFLLALGAGLAVASLYYSQPLLAVLQADLPAAAPGAVGWVPTLTQLGYALGILFFAPLGDRFDRRRIILAKLLMLAVTLLASALVPHLAALWVASFITGLAATVAQDIVPAAATLAPEQRRGKAVGTVMTGLLLGILLSRVLSGLVGEQLGWRWVYAGAAAGVAALALPMARGLPRFAPTSPLGYPALMASLATLWRRHPALRRAALAQGLLAMGFSAFWSTLAVLLHQAPFHLGSAAAGAFGLAGAAGALAAPLAGRLADRRGPELVARGGALVSAVAFGAMALATQLPAGAQLAALVVITVVFDFGVQGALVAHQTLVYGLEPPARSRLNALLFTGMFVGMASGAALGSLALARAGTVGVAALATTTALLALAVRCWPQRAGARLHAEAV